MDIGCFAASTRASLDAVRCSEQSIASAKALESPLRLLLQSRAPGFPA
jgi:hypothetical protein